MRKKLFFSLTISALILAILGLFVYFYRTQDTRVKVVLIGVDGLEWSIVKELVKEGKMPTFARLIQEGACGRTNSYINDKLYPSPALWTAIATGKGSNKNGIFGFVAHEDDKYELVPTKSYHRKVKALWNILSDRGKRVGVINYPVTLPLEAINGFIVSQKAAIPDQPNYGLLNNGDVLPNSLVDEINVMLKNNNRNHNNNHNIFEKEASNINRKLDWLSELSVTLYKKYNKNLALFITYVSETDIAQHLFWKFMEPDKFQSPIWNLDCEDVKKYGDFIKDAYQRIEGMVKGIIKYTDKDTIIIICSDHGFEAKDSLEVHLDNLNNLLEAIGFLDFKDDSEPKSIDFSKTRAYHYQVNRPYLVSDVLIRINLKGREPQGIVEPGEENTRIKRQLIDALSDLKTLETKEKLFSSVLGVAEEADVIISLSNAAALLKQHIKINDKIYPLNKLFSTSDYSGGHNKKGDFKGLLIIYGKNIRKAGSIEYAHILDIAPTVLYLLGLPISSDMEGRVLTQAIETGFLERNPIKYISSYEARQVKNTGPYKERTFEPIAKEEAERLKSLGYVR
jgi:predicted AlkP superfamily phosphohydrolase/phosphomutase